MSQYTVVPEDFGLIRCKLEVLQCSSKEQCRDMAVDVLKGIRGPREEIICLNAGAALYAAEKVASIREGMSLASRTLSNGAAYEKLMRIVEFSNKVAA